eukprot:CAMPEP_0174360278 /NCGR_PEP_ID=MMETSP0811_2-20130205/53325_1 /TAXON_ID=73025 ORGANISM="Eutreptiella gymnastica-like, Strain CCMP1594" /NCGR_SAMPLE_ID=MMETSP0811_2 /ASSEMBLY_ACC=CAM_ASM_000667 /LENGTH=115 /DNA_ID=CAMNT_0015495835 /DNA_START=171 /DNA_END=519 /DNA_ORIENTATION=+
MHPMFDTAVAPMTRPKKDGTPPPALRVVAGGVKKLTPRNERAVQMFGERAHVQHRSGAAWPLDLQGTGCRAGEEAKGPSTRPASLTRHVCTSTAVDLGHSMGVHRALCEKPHGRA